MRMDAGPSETGSGVGFLLVIIVLICGDYAVYLCRTREWRRPTVPGNAAKYFLKCSLLFFRAVRLSSLRRTRQFLGFRSIIHLLHYNDCFDLRHDLSIT